MGLVPWTRKSSFNVFPPHILKSFLRTHQFHRLSSEPVSSSVPGGCSLLFLALRCPPIFHILYFYILMAGGVHFFSFMLSNKFYASRSESFHFLSAWKTQSPFLLECFSLFPCFSLGLQLWRRHMLTHPSHLRTFLPSVSLPLSAAFWVTFPGGKKKAPQLHDGLFPYVSCHLMQRHWIALC